VARHARASHCWVTLQLSEDLAVTVGDDGRGIARTRDRGLGLNSMRERAAELGGSLTVARRPGGGTLVTAHLPLQAGAAGSPP
jgi:signal transduction histidine kinase